MKTINLKLQIDERFRDTYNLKKRMFVCVEFVKIFIGDIPEVLNLSISDAPFRGSAELVIRSHGFITIGEVSHMIHGEAACVFRNEFPGVEKLYFKMRGDYGQAIDS